MDFNKAIAILGLTRTFTEEDLKKAYRKLIAKYHPDKYETKTEKEKKLAEEKSKEINAAKECLESYLKNRNTSSRTNTRKNNNTYNPNDAVAVLIRKEQFKITLNNMIEELASFSFLTLGADATIINKAKNDISLLINRIEKQINSAYTLESIRNLESIYFNNLNSILDKFEKDYCKIYNIKIVNKKRKYSLKNLYEELKQLKREQNGFSVEELLDKELTIYVYYSGYIVIKNLINDIKNDIIKKNSIVMDTKENIIREFNKRVLKEFKEYYKRLEVLNKFKQLNLTKPKLKNLIKSLEENIANPLAFKYFSEQLINAIADLEIQQIPEEPKIYNNKENIYKIYKEKLKKKN